MKVLMRRTSTRQNLAMHITKKLILVFMAAVVRASVGAMLGYGPLLRYKIDGVLNLEMGTTEY